MSLHSAINVLKEYRDIHRFNLINQHSQQDAMREYNMSHPPSQMERNRFLGQLTTMLDRLDNIAVGSFNNIGSSNAGANITGIRQESIPITLTAKALKKLSKLNITKLKEQVTVSQDDKCAVCLDTIDNGEKEYMLLQCKHFFHYNCLYEYLQKYSYHCPICRKECGEHKANI